MRFADSHEPLSEMDLIQFETELGLKFPGPVRHLYLEANGGVPEPYVFSNENVDTVVCEFFPLKSTKGGTAIECYNRLVLDLKLVSPCFFPFAIEGGGEYFFVDCSSAIGQVYFYRSDTAEIERLVDLRLGFAEFWQSLKPE